jgi:uncharacterized protein YdeI (YjbR/CyaY-like superfamily)
VTPASDPVVSFPSRAAWDAWLARNHATSPGVRLKLARKRSGVETVTHADALEVALCYGWIDSQAGKLDDDHWVLRFTPRTRTSRWSRVNRDKAMELIARGEMKPAGLEEVARAEADGRWDAAYAAQSVATVPDDLRRQLDAHPSAREFFASLDSRNRYAILYRIEDAKRPETRARRIEKFVAMLEAGEKLYP